MCRFILHCRLGLAVVARCQPANPGSARTADPPADVRFSALNSARPLPIEPRLFVARCSLAPLSVPARLIQHGVERQAEARGETPEDAAGNDEFDAQQKVLRLRPARPDLRQHDRGLLRVHLVLRDSVSIFKSCRVTLVRKWRT